ncbi:hypothetical protein [Rhizobium etli]|uniref:hypothetical protein n=1 Tax=Rhizobium etli TaxID=29449 RepID=UPI0012DB0BBF|nr:hypothetical protein [Rhizobium etli]
MAKLRIGADGTTRFVTTHHEFGKGMRTALGAVLLDGLEIDPARGSWGTFSVVPIAALAVERMRAALSNCSVAGRGRATSIGNSRLCAAPI